MLDGFPEDLPESLWEISDVIDRDLEYACEIQNSHTFTTIGEEYLSQTVIYFADLLMRVFRCKQIWNVLEEIFKEDGE